MTMRAWSLLVALAAPLALAAEPAVLREAWIALPAPGARVAAGYLVIENREARPLQVVAVEVVGFRRAEVHESLREGERMTMRRRPTLEVAAGAALALAPGGLHLMLFDPASAPTVGASHEVRFTLADGRTLGVRATVRDARAHHH